MRYVYENADCMYMIMLINIRIDTYPNNLLSKRNVLHYFSLHNITKIFAFRFVFI